jgi:short-subunit dehydrogenase
MSLYAASKHGLNGFTNAMRQDLRADGIRVTLVILGAVGDTALLENNFTREDREHARPVWDADGCLARVGAVKPMTSAAVSQIVIELITRPAEIGQDVMHIRPAG